MPIPMITLIQNGKGFLGKQQLVKEFILMPKPNVNLSEVKFYFSKASILIHINFSNHKRQLN